MGLFKKSIKIEDNLNIDLPPAPAPLEPAPKEKINLEAPADTEFQPLSDSNFEPLVVEESPILPSVFDENVTSDLPIQEEKLPEIKLQDEKVLPVVDVNSDAPFSESAWIEQKTHLEIPEKLNVLRVPTELPSIPLPFFTNKLSNAPVHEEIPFFQIEMIEPELEQLPVLDISDSEETLKNFKERKPLYIRTDYYSQVLSTMDTLKNYVDQSTEMLYSLENLKKNVEIEHKNYRGLLEDIQRKIIYVDKVLFEKEG